MMMAQKRTCITAIKEVLTSFVDVAIKEVMNEHGEEGKDVIDDALAKDEDAKTYMTCLKCTTEVESRKCNCTNCMTQT